MTLNDYDNLGVGYLAAVLLKEGFEVKIIDARKKKSIHSQNTEKLLILFS